VEEFIERRIITGLIVSTDYIQQVYPIWQPRLLESPTAKILASWCIEYYDSYGKAPGRDIEGIYTQKLREGLSKDRAEWIEDVLADLSDDYDRGNFNVQYLVDQTRQYFQERHLLLFANDIKGELDAGNVTQAAELASGYTSITTQSQSSIDPFSNEARSVVRQAFEEREKPLVRFPKALGEFWNRELVRGAFVALLGPEKRGKTFMLMEIAIRAVRSGCNVVFFQAGDMTEKQQIRRLAIYLTKRSDDERYCGTLFLPTVDCVYNQDDSCDKEIRECDFGLKNYQPEMTYEALVEAYEEHPDYRACHNCDDIKGAVWLTRRGPVQRLDWKQAYKALRAFGKKYPTRFKLSSYANGTLSVMEIKALLNVWERQERFVPDVIVIDYIDILAPDPDFSRMDFRHRRNELWQRLRNLSEERHSLVVTATQAAASSYGKEILRLSDFSEDKRVYAHVTAMYGLNQTEEEKQIGIMRINEMVVREADYSSKRTVKVLQRLETGRPFLGSFR
jgi:hypothetical protein